MKKHWLNCLYVLIVMVTFCAAPVQGAYADVGNQNDYGGSEEEYSSDNRSNDEPNRASERSNSSESLFNSSTADTELTLETLIDFVIVVVAFALVIGFFMIRGDKNNPQPIAAKQKIRRAPPSSDGPKAANAYGKAKQNEAIVIAEIKEHDPFFSEQTFEGWAREVFLTLNEAWAARDIDRLYPLETSALFSEHSRLLKQYLSNRQINKIERLGIGNMHLSSFTVDKEFEYIEVMLKAQLIDYIIDEDTGETIIGDRDSVTHMIYTLTFARTAGTLSSEDPADIRTTDCPSCGAPIQITAGGRCEYCHSILQTNKHGWVLCAYTGSRI